MEFNVKNVSEYFVKATRSSIPKATKLFEDEAKKITPEDTKKMLGSYTNTTHPTSMGSEGEIKNDAPYAIYVEYGAGVPYNYHKPRGSVVFTGIGNKTMRRTADNNKDKINKILLDEIEKG